jgi:MscS family membrane protein
MQYLESEFLGNRIIDIIWLLGILIFGLLFRRFLADFFSKTIYRFMSYGSVPIRTFVEMLGKPVRLLITLIFTYLASNFVHFPISWNLPPQEVFGIKMILLRVFQGTFIFAVAWILVRITKFISLIFQERAALTTSKLDDQFIPFFKDLVVVIISILTIFILLGIVFKVDVVALVTGLGIGGLAIALAARETLENLFASFTIFLDLPFVVGDNIQLDKVSGDVENIGFRSTRIRTGDGSLITVPNRLLTAQALENQTKRKFMRAKYTVKLQSDTSIDTLEKIIREINQTIHNQELSYKPDPGITRFGGFGENSLEVLVSYNIATNDGALFNKIKEQINYQIMSIIKTNETKFTNPILQPFAE